MAAYDFSSREFAWLRRAIADLRLEYCRRDLEQPGDPQTVSRAAELTALRSKLALYAGETVDADELEPTPADEPHVRAYREGRRLADELRCRYCGALATSVHDAVAHAFGRHRGELLEEFGIGRPPS